MSSIEGQEKIDHYDIIIAGAGIAGTLAVNRLFQTLDGVKILILEKGQKAGGRALSYEGSNDFWGYGLNFLSTEVLDYISHSYSIEPELQFDESLRERSLKTGAILAGGKLNQFSIAHCFSPEGAKALGGNAAVREWPKVDSLLGADEDHDKASFAKMWKEGKKNPASTVLEHYSSFCGLTDLWKSSPRAVYERAQYFQSGLHTGPWNKVIEQLLSFPDMNQSVQVELSCRIIDANYNDESWSLTTEKGVFSAKTLLIAQSPWETIEWLDRSSCPLPVLQAALKTKPTSVVTLSTQPKNMDSIDDFIYLPAEEVMIIKTSEDVITFQSVIDYESSLNAPAVLKAVKRLKRARKKLEKFNPDLMSEKEHLALVPIAWSQSTHISERKIQQALSKTEKYQLDHLSFCGDSYGDHYCPDVNLLKSLTSACSALSASFKQSESKE